MNKIKIRYESYAKRCEICHQNDQFEPLTSFCKRCNKIRINEKRSAVFHYIENRKGQIMRRLAFSFVSMLGGAAIFPLITAIKYHLLGIVKISQFIRVANTSIGLQNIIFIGAICGLIGSLVINLQLNCRNTFERLVNQVGSCYITGLSISFILTLLLAYYKVSLGCVVESVVWIGMGIGLIIGIMAGISSYLIDGLIFLLEFRNKRKISAKW